MKNLKGPAIFLAQFMSDEAPFNTLDNAAKWMKDAGYEGIQLPAWDGRCIDIEKAAESKDYTDEIKGRANEMGLEVTDLATHLQGQLVAVHPAYDIGFDAFAPAEVHNNPKARAEWATKQVQMTLKASRNFGVDQMVTFSGSLMWHLVYPWPQRPPGLVEDGFKALAEKWMPILEVAEDVGVDVCYEIHPGEDLHDGITFERFLEATNHHPRVKILYDPSHFILQQLDYIQYIDIYHEYIRMFHVKDAEFNPTGRGGVYGGYQDWIDRPGRFRSPGDGQVDFKTIFSKLAQYDFDGWAVVEWECCMKHPEDGAREGAEFVKDHLIRVTDKSFDDFAGGGSDKELNKRILGI